MSKFLGIVLSILILGMFSFSNPEYKSSIDTNEKEVLKILEEKCNTCHKKELPTVIFTEENMRSYSRKINSQVFIWKRMPKGKEVKLTDDEKDLLKGWIRLVKK